MRNTESASADLERVAAAPESVKDGKIVALEDDLQKRKGVSATGKISVVARGNNIGRYNRISKFRLGFWCRLCA